MRVLVLTVSDRAAVGVYEDKSGPEVTAVLAGSFPDAAIASAVVPDEKASIRAAFEANAACDCIITTGGTGLSPRDVTPEATSAYCDRMVPGIAEMLRRESLRQTPYAALSRGVAGMKGGCIIINLPGSASGAAFCTELLVPLLRHAFDIRDGKGH